MTTHYQAQRLPETYRPGDQVDRVGCYAYEYYVHGQKLFSRKGRCAETDRMLFRRRTSAAEEQRPGESMALLPISQILLLTAT